MKYKELLEKRAQRMEEMERLTEGVKTEKRAFTEDEEKKFAELRAQIESIDRTIEALDQQRALVREPEPEPVPEERAGAKESQEDIDVRAFANIIRERADSNITKSDNGAIIPKTIADRIIDKVANISPLYRDAEKFNVKGNLSIPYVDTANDNITMDYAEEFVDLEAKSTKLLSTDLTGYLAGVLSKISISLLNSSDVDLTNFVIDKMATAVAMFIEKEMLTGTTKIKCLSQANRIVAAGSTSAITADNLIMLRNKLNSVYQQGAYFVMHPDTLTAAQLLKDGNQRYLFNDNVVEGFAGTILGKPVYTSDQMPQIESNKDVVYYINAPQALAAKLVEDSVQVLRETYATQHAIGVVNWLEVDAKIQNQQAVAALRMVASYTPSSSILPIGG